ncbi:MAG: putative toxin-antitoxin system toxin component, PIN family [Anaerolineales bacterium]|nr:putative toxin-antitoxin system toxin component, PIN family [Anaerolineales bacterium]
MESPNIVIDTNVIVAGLRSKRGSSYRLLQQVGRGHFDINLSVPLVLEYEEVLHNMLPFLALTSQDIENFIDYLCSVAHQHQIFYLWRPTLRDPSDEMLLELAVKAQCKWIVTFNTRDFHGSEDFGVTAVTPAEFLDFLEEDNQ